MIITISREHGSSGKRWGDDANYELTAGSSVGLEKTAEIIIKYVSGYTSRLSEGNDLQKGEAEI